MAAHRNCENVQITNRFNERPDFAANETTEISSETMNRLCGRQNNQEDHEHDNRDDGSGSLTWLDKAAAIDHQYAVFVDRHVEHSQICDTRSQTLTQHSSSDKSNQNVGNCNSSPHKLHQDATANVTDQFMSHNNIPKKEYMIKASTSGTDSNKPAYRMLVQRRSIFDGIDLNVADEGSSDLQASGVEDGLKCGHCSEMYVNREALICHLFTHNVSTIEQPVKKLAHQRKGKNLSKLKAGANTDKISEDLTEISVSREVDGIHRGKNKAVQRKQRNPRHQMNVKPRNETSLEISEATSAVVEERISTTKSDPKIHNDISPTTIEHVKQLSSGSARIRTEETSRHTMSSVGKRNAKKNLGDDFITFEPTRKKSLITKSKTKTPIDESSARISGSRASSQETSTNFKEKVTTLEIESCNSAPSYLSSASKSLHENEDNSSDAGSIQTQISSPQIFVKHSDVTSKTVLRCITCKGCFLWKWPFLNHLKIHPNEKPYECLSCHRRLFSFFSYMSHVKHFHGPKKRFGCSKCGSSFRSKYLLKLHSKNHTETASFSDKVNKSSLHEHTLVKNKVKEHSRHTKESEHIRCKPCGKTFQDRRNLWIHQKRHPNAIKPYRCHVCTRRFAMHKWLTDHIQRHTPVRNFPCGICGKRYLTKSDATMHERRHTKEASFACTECDRKFIYKSELNAHHRRHQGIKLPKNIECDVCKKSFATRRDLERHMTVHTGEKPFRCHVCGKSFSQEVNMQVHMKIHSGVKPYQCDLCEKRFIAKSKLKRHRQCHSTAKGMLDRPYKCVLCPRKYTAENSLIRHLRTHKNSPETITNITTALNKAAEESSVTESSTTAGAVLACMIDQAISDAKHKARRRKKAGGAEDSSLAEIIDQAIHNSKASCSTQTPIIIENFNNTYVNIQLPSSSSVENSFQSSNDKDKNITVSNKSSKETTVGSCGDLIKLISDALIKHNETEQISQTKISAEEPYTTETIVVEPKAEVINPSPISGGNSKQTNQVIGVSTPQMHHFSSYRPGSESRLTDQSAPAFQDQQTPLIADNVQQIYVHTLNFPVGGTNSLSQEESLVTPVVESIPMDAEQYITVSDAASESFVLQSLLQSVDNSGQQNVMPIIVKDNLDLPSTCSNQLLSPSTTTPVRTTSSNQQQVVTSQQSSINVKATSDLNKEVYTCVPSENLQTHTEKVHHIIVKTSVGQTFLIPSALISLNESSPLLITTLPATSTQSENATGSCIEPVTDQIIKDN